MKIWHAALLALALVAFALLVRYRGADIVRSLRLGPPQMIVAEVHLVNNCQLRDSYFELYVPSSDTRHAFRRGVVHLSILEGTYVELRLARRFPDVTFSGPRRKAQPYVELVAQCGTGDALPWLDDSVRSRFGN